MNDILKSSLVGRASGRPAGNARVGKDNVELSEVFGQGCKEPLAIFRNSNVCAVATGARPKFGDRFIQRLLVTAGNGDLCTFRDEKSGGGQTNTTVTASNKSAFACELHSASFLYDWHQTGWSSYL